MAEKKERIVHGKHPVLEALRAETPIDRILVRNKGWKGSEEVLRLAKEKGVPFQKVPPAKLDKLVKGNHQGVLAFTSPIRFADPEEILSSAFDRDELPLYLLLDGVTDVRNFGAICRTAECCGVDAVFVPAKGGARVNSDAVRTSAGALERLPVARVWRMNEMPELFGRYGISMFACTEKAEKSLIECNLDGPLALVLGDEGEGISPGLLDRIEQKGHLPMAGGIASLNVSVATGMLLYEVLRQRRG